MNTTKSGWRFTVTPQHARVWIPFFGKATEATKSYYKTADDRTLPLRRSCRCWDGESRCRLRFAPKPSQSGRIRGHALGQEFQGDATVQLEVFGLVDHTHPAAAELAQDAVVRDRLADHGLKS